jgi:hypothetical protein
MSKPTNLNNMAHVVAHKTDKLITRLIRLMSTPLGRDKTLCTLQYLLIVIHTQLSRLQGLHHRRYLISLSQKLGAVMLPGETIVATLAAQPETRLGHVIGGSKALADLISDFRCFARVVETLELYTWAKATWLTPPEDAVVKGAVWAQIASIVLYQYYENVAYLASKGVLRGEAFDKLRQDRWWLSSSRYWMAYIALEGVRLARTWQLNGSAAAAAASDGVEKKTQRERSEADALWKRQMTVNMAWAPVSYHYSVEAGWLSSGWLGVFGLIAGSTGLRNLWKQAA